MRLLIGFLGALLLMPVVESVAAAQPPGLSRSTLGRSTQGRGRHVRKRVRKKRHHAKRKKNGRGGRPARAHASHEL